MKVLTRPIYRFDRVEVDPSQRSLRRDGEELTVRHQSFQVLIYLLEQRHRPVTKEDLIAYIWQSQAVTDDSLVQVIIELRRSLGDDPRRPRFIKTVPKVGYRFIAPVEELSFAQPVPQEIAQRTTVEIEFEETIVDEIDEIGEAHAIEAPPAKLLPPARVIFRFRLALVAITSVLLMVGPLAIYLAAKSSRSQAPLAEVTLPQVPGKHPLAVVYFDNQSASPDLDWLREGLADMLITGLSRSRDLTVLSRRQLQVLLERIDYQRGQKTDLNDALRIGRQSRAEIIVLGSFAKLDGSIRIDAQLQDARTGQTIASEQLIVDKPGDLFTQVDLLSLKIASRLGATPDDQQLKRGLAEVMTGDLQAYRCYSLALGKVSAFENTEALKLLEKAIALDPQFAMAQARIGHVYVSWGMPEKARPYLEKAFQLSARLTEKDRLSITAWYEMANLDYPSAIVTFRKIIAQYPLEVEAYRRLSHLLQGEERFAEAIEVAKEGLAIDPEAKDIYNGLGNVYSILGRHEESIRMRRRYVELAAEEPNSHDSLGLSYQWAGRYEEAIEEYQRALELKADFEVAMIHLANTYFQLGRYREAIENYRRYLEIAPSDLERDRGYTAIAYVYIKRGDLPQVEQIIKSARQSRAATTWAAMSLALARGEVAKGEKLRAEYFAKRSAYSDRGARINQRSFYQLRGYSALKSGRSAEAIEDFKAALKHRALIWNIDSGEDCLADAYLELGRLDEAIAEYERILRLNPAYPLAHYHLAQAYERKGETARARAMYGEFLRLWEKADPDVPEVVAARQRVLSERCEN
jgi:tetratricopeptide (TPR) repeat protein/DNA-binding winged helix-turn-helix (wHTH) protein/TolB-like protein